MMHLSQQQQKLKDSIRNEDEANGNNNNNNSSAGGGGGGDGQQGGKWPSGKNGGEDGNRGGGDKGGGGDLAADGEDGLACLIDPSTGKKMTKKRMQQLAQFGGLPPSQIEELKERGYLQHFATILPSRQKQISQLAQLGTQKFQQ